MKFSRPPWRGPKSMIERNRILFTNSSRDDAQFLFYCTDLEKNPGGCRNAKQGGRLRQKYSISEYEDLWQSNPQRYGCVPVQQAIDSLHMDAQAVSALIDKGALECFEIGDDPGLRSMVSLKSLLIFKAAKAVAPPDRPGRILKILTEAARNKMTLLYGDIMQAVGLTYRDAMHRQMFRKDLRAATQQSEIYAHGLLISALLVFKIQHIAEDDFFLMAQELGMFAPGKDSKTVFFKDHLERIFKYYEEN
jgi:hypothetical protein